MCRFANAYHQFFNVPISQWLVGTFRFYRFRPKSFAEGEGLSPSPPERAGVRPNINDTKNCGEKWK